MYTVKTLPEFDKWLNGLKDRMTKQRLIVRLRKAALGNLGDVKPVGDIMMLGGGDKGSQEKDIATAKQRNSMLEEKDEQKKKGCRFA